MPQRPLQPPSLGWQDHRVVMENSFSAVYSCSGGSETSEDTWQNDDCCGLGAQSPAAFLLLCHRTSAGGVC